MDVVSRTIHALNGERVKSGLEHGHLLFTVTVDIPVPKRKSILPNASHTNTMLINHIMDVVAEP